MSRLNRKGRGKPKWRVIETRIKNNAAVQVSELPLKVPRYSFKVGTAHFPDDVSADAQGTVEPEVGPRLTIFNVLDAADLLKELGEKYTTMREARIDEVEERRARWQTDSESGIETEITEE